MQQQQLNLMKSLGKIVSLDNGKHCDNGAD